MASRLDTEIIINLAGNLTAKARQYGANMSEFAQRNQRAMSIVKATSEAAGRGLDRLGNRYTTAIAGFAGGAMLRNYATVDRRLTRLGVSADKTREQMATIFNDVQDVAISFKVDSSEVVAALEEINGRTGDMEFGLKNLKGLAATIAGSGSSGAAIGGIFAEFKKYGITDGKDGFLAMDVLNKLGKEGAFELKDLAEKATPSLSLYAAAGGRGVQGVKDVGVLLESAIGATGNRDTAATLVENFIREIQNPKIANALKKKGVNVKDKSGQLRSLPELLEEIARKSKFGGSKKGGLGQIGELQQVGFTQTSLDLISGVSSKSGIENLRRFMGVTADGSSIEGDAKYVGKDFTSALQSLTTTGEKFANANLAKPVQELADALNSVDQATVQNWLEIGKNVAIATGGLLVARKGFQIGKGAYDFLRPGKKGVPKGVTDVFGSGVMPVYVVNMGSGGLGGATPGNAKGTGNAGLGGGAATAEAALGTAGKWALARAVGTGAGMAYLQNETARWAAQTIYDGSGVGEWAKGSSFRNWVDDSVDKSQLPQPVSVGSVWQEVKDWLTSAPAYQDPSPWASLQPQNQQGFPLIPPPLQEIKGKIEVSVSDDRVQVKNVQINAPGVNLSAQTGPRNVGQE
ncbi:phage tail protein [Serratia marcescens]|uniref:Phage tail tape measure protein n=1 Tax=Serratia marcescens TaxID=615 RepID=A0ABD5BHQ0_SERMA|nr:phage tail tape measure protein [Serratia marcescens]MCZ6928676.1 phage tail protein [Serratia marcescens]MDE5234329.1 phage tail tape measure protein [Serratia marcescens]MDE5257504.1 phage tail tape measure protein [Serratia marcescens]MDQ9402284.1 phage tail tape measure protein [Serratia marcescens]MDQ9424665.1 phage tail tape measure protein [Serratia marcescens]